MNIGDYMKSKKIKITAAVLAFCVLGTFGGKKIMDVYAVDKSDVDDAQQQIQDTQNKIDKLNSELSQLDSDIASIEAYVSELDSTINSIATNISSCQSKIDSKQAEIDAKNVEINNKIAEIDSTEVELEEAAASEESQYESMKKRIQYMYECGDESFLDMIMSSEDLSDMLGNAEYVSSIVAYDRNQLQILADTKEKIDNLLVQLQDDKANLESQRSELETQKTELVTLQNDLQSQYQLVNDALSTKETMLQQLESQQEYAAVQKQLEEAKLAAQQREAEALRQRWLEEVRNAANNGQDADEANKRKLEEIGLAGGFTWPLPGYSYITSYFGPRKDPFGNLISNHSGMDISGFNVYGKPVVACYSGTIISVDVYTSSDNWTTKPYGTSIKIDHGAGVVTLYAHLSGVNVSVGQTVSAGDTIGFVGSTGKSTGAHLHLTLYIKGVLADPLPYLKRPS